MSSVYSLFTFILGSFIFPLYIFCSCNFVKKAISWVTTGQMSFVRLSLAPDWMSSVWLLQIFASINRKNN